MRWQAIASDWEYFRPKVKRHWTSLTDSQLDRVNGSYDRLVECLQESYGLSADVVKDDVREWCFSFGEEELREEALRTPLDEMCDTPAPRGGLAHNESHAFGL